MAMSIKQKQWQLFFLGYYGESTADIDGIWGKNSKAATVAFQKDVGIKDDGIFGISTENKSMEVVDNIQDVIAPYSQKSLYNDGLAGPATMAAMVWYQKAKGLTPNGIVDPETRTYILNSVGTVTDTNVGDIPEEDEEEDIVTGTFWDEIKHFTRNELRCKCGGRYCNGFPAEPQELLVRLAERARVHFGAPAHNVSCLRCKTWNAKSGGVANSQHMYGEAMDIRIEGVSGDTLLAFFLRQPEVRYAYKINSTNVHFDIPKGAR